MTSKAPEYRLRPATPHDQPWLETLRRSVYQELMVLTFGGWDEARHARHCAECWARGPISVVEVADERVGMIQLHERPEAIEIGEIQVHPSRQNQGIGSRILRDTLAHAQRTSRKVVLSVALKNDRAHRLYRRLGFRDVSRSDTHHHLEWRPPEAGGAVP